MAGDAHEAGRRGPVEVGGGGSQHGLEGGTMRHVGEGGWRYSAVVTTDEARYVRRRRAMNGDDELVVSKGASQVVQS
jgi:hypothetical protein